jgi:predicted permease
MLEACSLTKYYSHTPAVRNVSFTLNPGEILGYLGANGAGKSTTVKMLTGLIEPSDGRILFEGHSVYDNFTAYQRRIGYVPEEADLYPHLSGWEYLQLAGRLRGMPRGILEPRIEEFLRLFSLWEDRHDPLSSYSKGMRQKILLSGALLHNPDLLILDEPFSGLDVTSALMLRNLLGKLAAQGKMILFSSHVLEVVEKVCTKVLILRKGEVVACDSIDHLQELMSQPSLEGVFSQLTKVQDTETVADRILNVMTSGGPPTPGPPESGITEPLPKPARRVANLFADLQQDIRYGFRSLLASPGFTAVALLSLSLGIAIATCAFSEMNGMVLRALPGVQKPAELVGVQSPVSYPSYRRFSAQRDIFSSAMAYAAPVPFAVSIGGSTERTWGHLVSTSYFSTLGVQPALGAFFDPARETAGEAPAVVLGDDFWRNRLGGDPSIVGKTLRINGQPSTVIGVAPAGFFGASPFLFKADLWMPVTVGGEVAPELAGNALERRDISMFFVVGRLKPGVAAASAEAELDAVARQFERDRIDVNSARKDRRVLLVDSGKLLPLRKQDIPFFTSFFTIMAVLIMLLACANVANMMLARAAGRRREIAVRLALGASRARLVRQLLTESTVIAVGAGMIGFLASVWLMSLSAHERMPLPMPVAFDLRPDGRVFLLTLALSLCTGLLFGLAPALQATRTDLAQALKQGGNIFARANRRFSLRNLLIVSQVAGSLTLLVVLGLLSIGIQTTLGIQAGFNSNNLYSVAIDPARDGYSAARATAYFDRVLERVKSLPSIASATLTETVPVSMPGTGVMVSTPAASYKIAVRAVKHVVGKDYFDTTAIPIRAGRGFRKEDEAEQSAAVIITEILARQLWEGGQPVGRAIEIRNGEITPPKILPGSFDHRPTVSGDGVRTLEVVGVAADVAEGLAIGKPQAAIYFPLHPSSYGHPPLQGITLMFRAAPGANALRAVLHEISAIDDRITPFNAHSMKEQIDDFMTPLKVAAWTYALIGIFGLALASVGLAGVTAYSVAQRRREIGIRMALGARPRNVLSLVMNESLLLVAAGTGVGMAGAWAGARLLAAMNAQVGNVTSTSTSDITILFGAPLLLAALALIACYLPARRSVRIDPVVVLRQE